MDPTKSYNIFPETPGEVRTLGQFEFSNLGNGQDPHLRWGNTNRYSWRYIPEPGEATKDYVDERKAYGTEDGDATKVHKIDPYRNEDMCGNPINRIYFTTDIVRKKLLKVYKEDFKLWKHLRYKLKTEEEKKRAEELGVTLTDYRKEVASKKLRKKAINNTSDKMEVAKFLVSVKDQIDGVLSCLERSDSYSLETISKLRYKMNGFSGPIYAMAKKIARKTKKK